MKDAQYICALDADFNNDDIKWLNFFTKYIILIKSTVPRQKRNFIMIEQPISDEKILKYETKIKNAKNYKQIQNYKTRLENGKRPYERIISLLKAGKKIIMASGAKDIVDKMVKILIGNDFKQYNRHTKTGDFLVYTSETEKYYDNISTDWKNCKFVAYTSIITCGVNFNPEIYHFDICWLHASASSVTVPEYGQMIERNRKLNDNLLLLSVNKNIMPRMDIPIKREHLKIWAKKQTFD